MRIDEAFEADMFVAEFFGEDTDAGSDRSRLWVGEQPEPFFGDAKRQCWRVVARPGATDVDLKSTDLVVQRSGTGKRRSWHCRLGGDVDLDSIYGRGSDRRLRDDTLVLRRVRRFRLPLQESVGETYPEIVEVCGFFGPNSVRRTEQEIRTAVVARANAEWTAWHTTAGAPRPENEVGMFGRLVGYYLAAVGAVKPDSLTAVQATAIGGTINYAPLLAAGMSAATIATQADRIRDLLIAGAPGAPGGIDAGLGTHVRGAILGARQAHFDVGPPNADLSAWSAAFVSGCVRGAGITQGLEGAVSPGRQHSGKDALLLASLSHATYTIGARQRRAATSPRHRGTYHAFTPAERAPQVGDIIVQDRRKTITEAQVRTLANLATGMLTHGDIVVEVQQAFVVAIGGNVGDRCRKRRYPRTDQGLLVVDRQRRYTTETDAGVLPALPAPVAVPSTQALGAESTRRIFALLSLVQECAAVPGQPYGGGVLV